MAKLGRILVIDDEANARGALAELLREEGYDVETAADAFKGLGKYDEFEPDVVLTDLKMPGMDGISLLKKLTREREHDAAVIVMTAFGAVETAVEAMRAGASDYLTKPINFDELLVVVSRSLERQRIARSAVAAETERQQETDWIAPLVGDHPDIQAARRLISHAAATDLHLVVSGESGTGKSQVARFIHDRSRRSRAPLIPVGCRATDATERESTIFGSSEAQGGAWARAGGGTLIIEDIDALPLSCQERLLHALEATAAEEKGSLPSTEVFPRVIATTSDDIKTGAREGRFSRDLLYLLETAAVQLPPLRDRKNDIAIVAHCIASSVARENHLAFQGFSNDAIEVLVRYGWPGNVRELASIVGRSIITARSPRIAAQNLPAGLDSDTDVNGLPPIPGSTLEAIERYAILATLEACHGSTSKAAEVLGISVRKVQYKLHDYQEAPKSSIDAVENDPSD